MISLDSADRKQWLYESADRHQMKAQWSMGCLGILDKNSVPPEAHGEEAVAAGMAQAHFVQHKLLALDGCGLTGHPGLRQLARVRVAHLKHVPEDGVLRLLPLHTCTANGHSEPQACL